MKMCDIFILVNLTETKKNTWLYIFFTECARSVSTLEMNASVLSSDGTDGTSVACVYGRTQDKCQKSGGGGGEVNICNARLHSFTKEREDRPPFLYVCDWAPHALVKQPVSYSSLLSKVVLYHIEVAKGKRF